MPEISSLPSQRTKPAPPSSRAQTTILLVDDDALVRTALKAVLSYAGFNVLACEDGASAVSLFSLRPNIDVLVTDFQMPEMTGYALAEELTRGTPRLPVVVVSGAAMDELPLQEIAEHDWRFLPKPVNREALLVTIDGLCAAARGRRLSV